VKRFACFLVVSAITAWGPGCGSSSSGPPGPGAGGASSSSGGASSGGPSSGADAGGAGDGGVLPTDGGAVGDGGGADGGVLAGPLFDPGFVACSQPVTLDDAALAAACQGTMGGMPYPAPTTPLECGALTGHADVAVGCETTPSGTGSSTSIEIWVRLTARSTGAWTYDPNSEVVSAYPSYLPRCFSETQTSFGLMNDADPGGTCGSGWQGEPFFTTTADATIARVVGVPGSFTASGQTISGTVWFPFEEAAAPPSMDFQTGFALAIPFGGTVP
jgi:hypothetical protein